MKVQFDLCGTIVDLPKTAYDNNRVVANAALVGKWCEGKQEAILSIRISTGEQNSTGGHSHDNQTTSAIIVLDYPTHTLLLAEGIVSEVRLYPEQLPFKVFHYDLTDNDDTLVRVFSEGKV